MALLELQEELGDESQATHAWARPAEPAPPPPSAPATPPPPPQAKAAPEPPQAQPKPEPEPEPEPAKTASPAPAVAAQKPMPAAPEVGTVAAARAHMSAADVPSRPAPAPSAAPSAGAAPRPAHSTPEPLVESDGLSPNATKFMAAATFAIVLVVGTWWAYNHYYGKPAQSADAMQTASTDKDAEPTPADIDPVEKKIAQYDEQVEGAAKKIDEAPAPASGAEDLAPLKQRIGDIAKSTEAIPPLIKRFEGVTERVDDFEKSVKSVRNDVAALPARGEATAKTEGANGPDNQGHDAAKADTPKTEIAKAETPKAEMVKAETPKAETPKEEVAKVKTPKAATPKEEVVKRETPKQDPAAASASHSISDAERRDPARPLLEDLEEEAEDGSLTEGIELFKQNRFKEAYAIFEKMEKTNPDDARVWYYAALSYGHANNDWKVEPRRLVQKGVEREKAGTPKRPEIDAAFRDLDTARGKEWLAEYRKMAAAK